MSSQNAKRGTQFDVLALTRLDEPTSTTEPEGHVAEGQQPLQDRQIVENAPPKRKRARSLVRAVDPWPGTIKE